ncbi:hypothetical protein DDI_4447 [Dickeya dianthicola RNS04.9]|nr:hypothetical protein DDI_4447 [Dickeya dianthicola RNS04.9]
MLSALSLYDNEGEQHGCRSNVSNTDIRPQSGHYAVLLTPTDHLFCKWANSASF